MQFFVIDITQLALLQVASGFAMGGTLASLSATLANLAPEGQQGTVYGVDASIVSLANAVAPMVGTTIAVAWSLQAPFLCAAIFFCLAGLVTSRILPPVKKTT
jgi:MFS family permease